MNEARNNEILDEPPTRDLPEQWRLLKRRQRLKKTIFQRVCNSSRLNPTAHSLLALVAAFSRDELSWPCHVRALLDISMPLSSLPTYSVGLQSSLDGTVDTQSLHPLLLCIMSFSKTAKFHKRLVLATSCIRRAGSNAPLSGRARSFHCTYTRTPINF